MPIKQAIRDRVRIFNKHVTNKILIHIAGRQFGHFAVLGHTGRKSGRPRQTVVEVVRHDPPSGAYWIASGWGEKSDWYRNVRHNPDVTVTCGRQRMAARAERLSPAEAEAELRRYAERYPAAARSLAKLFFGRPMEDPAVDFPALSQQMPILVLRPRPAGEGQSGSSLS